MSDKIDEEDPRCFAVHYHTLKSLHCKISQYVSADYPIWSDSSESAAFLDAIDEFLNLIAGEKSIAAFIDPADDLLELAMFRLEDEFRLLIERSGESFDEDGVDKEDGDDRIPVGSPISDLSEIAKRMVTAGFEEECAHVYSSCRRGFLEESISRLGLQRPSIEEVQKMTLPELKSEKERWMKGVNDALRTLFPRERKICNRIFFGLSSTADLSFMEVCRGSTFQLLNFADAVAISSRSPDSLFKVLDVFETLRDLMPAFEAVFSGKYCAVLRNEAATIWKRLGEAIRGIFMELENLIRIYHAKEVVPGGGLHPITRYVINYLRAACGSRQTLEQVFEDNGTDYRNPDDTDRSLSSSSALSVQITWIMELLQSNLEAKSKMYKNSAWSSLFLMNNGRYIVQKVKDGKLASLLGDDWIRKQTRKVRQCQVNFQRSSWSKVLAVLKLDSGSLDPNMASKILKEKLKVFTVSFDEICRNQSTWVVADEQLRMELRISAAGNLSPAYRNFLERFQNVPELGKQADKYIKYSVEDIEARINELFQGSSGSVGGRN